MEKDMEQVMRKAEVLIEALPYIQKFNRKIIVVKYGGSAMSNEELQKNVIKDVTLLKLVGFKPIIVHGGGKEISRWVGKVGKEAKFINGLRVTDEETMEIAEMVLNKVNKSLVTMVEELGVKAVGVSGKDGGLLQVEKKYSDGQAGFRNFHKIPIQERLPLLFLRRCGHGSHLEESGIDIFNNSADSAALACRTPAFDQHQHRELMLLDLHLES